MRSLKLLGVLFISGAIVSLSACGSDEAEASAECLQAMEVAAAEKDPDAAEPLIEETLSACGTADEWLAALEQRPGAMGLTERAEIDDMTLQAPCYGYPNTPVCEDAVSEGRILHPN